MTRRINLIGKTFGCWEVVGVAPRPKGSRTYSVCRCQCGAIREIQNLGLSKGKAAPCPCQVVLKPHGHTSKGRTTATYRSWCSMIQRVTNPKHCAYAKYKDREIDPRWLDYRNFLSDLGERPLGTTLDRIDNSLGYFPSNCRWATPLVQALNRGNTVQIEYQGVQMPISKAAKISGINLTTLHYRVTNKWPTEKLFTNPADYHRSKDKLNA